MGSVMLTCACTFTCIHLLVDTYNRWFSVLASLLSLAIFLLISERPSVAHKTDTLHQGLVCAAHQSAHAVAL